MRNSKQDHCAVFGILFKMIIKTDNTKEQGQKEKCIPGFIGKAVRDIILWAQAAIIQEIDPADPVAVQNIAIHALVIVLPSDKIPEEVTEIHVIQLVTEKIPQVFPEGRDMFVVRIVGDPGPALIILVYTGLPGYSTYAEKWSYIPGHKPVPYLHGYPR